MKAFFLPMAKKNGETFTVDKVLKNGSVMNISSISFNGENKFLVEDAHSEGTGVANFFDSANVGLKKVKLYGATRQDRYEGYNYISLDYATETLYGEHVCNGITYYVNEMKEISVVGTATDRSFFYIADQTNPINLIAGKTYYLSAGKWKSNIYVFFEIVSEDESECYSLTSGTLPFTVKGGNYYCRIRLEKGKRSNGDTIRPLLSENQNAVFEPYVGLKPSPSKDFPQDLVCIADDSIPLRIGVDGDFYIKNIVNLATLSDGKGLKILLNSIGDVKDSLTINLQLKSVLYDKQTEVLTPPSNYTISIGQKAKYATMFTDCKDVMCSNAIKVEISSPEQIGVDEVAICGNSVVIGCPLNLTDAEAREYFSTCKFLVALTSKTIYDLTISQFAKTLISELSKHGIFQVGAITNINTGKVEVDYRRQI